MSTLAATCRCGNITTTASNVEHITVTCWQCDVPPEKRWMSELPKDIRHWPENVRREIAYEMRGMAPVEPGVAIAPKDFRSMSRHVPIRFDRDTIDRAIPVAEETGLTVSSWIRELVEDAIAAADNPSRMDDGRLYRNAQAPRWVQLVEIADEWCHEHTAGLTGWRNVVAWWLCRPLCGFREWWYLRGAP